MFSFSKGFGMVGNRLGLVYTKKPHKTLHLLKDFENWNYASVRTMDLLMSNYAVDEMFNRHRQTQINLCKKYSLVPSDCFFLATSGDPYYKKRRRAKGNPVARLCLTNEVEW
jgi:aspartate/methionine/tyrosine aminotransferase